MTMSRERYTIYSSQLDANEFAIPPECYISMEEYCYEDEYFDEEIIQTRYDSMDKEIIIDPEHSFNFASIMDMSDMIPGEIEIEDEIRMGYLWKKYKK